MNDEKIAALRKEFIAKFKFAPRIFRAPGRVNLIGEHTDYNDGFVMPAAIDFATYVAAGHRADKLINVASEKFHDDFQFDPDNAGRQQNWADYVQGVAVELKKKGCDLDGADLLIDSNVPMGAGLSSSAALEVSVALALLGIANIQMDKLQIAQLCQRAENNFVGMKCGIMDQFISCFGREHHAVMLDCRTMESQALPIPENARLVICNTMVKHELASSAYNERRADCEAAAKLLGANSLRDISLEEFNRLADELPEQLRKRARHVITENKRVQQAATALLNHNLDTFGSLMNASHESLRADYEVSCKELDVMVEVAQRQSGIYGARMTGGGFGGCTINLVEVNSVQEFRERVSAAYQLQTGITPDIYICQPARGAEEILQFGN